MNSSATDERALAERLAARDHGAMAELYDRFSPYVYAVAQRVSRDGDAAHDVTQEVFLRVWHQVNRYDPDRGSLRAWLGTLSHHAAAGWVRRQVAARRREERVVTHASVEAAEDVALRHVVADRLRAAVARLPQPQRRAVELAYFHGLTFRQVAERLNIPEGTAKSRLRLALGKLAVQLA